MGYCNICDINFAYFIFYDENTTSPKMKKNPDEKRGSIGKYDPDTVQTIYDTLSAGEYTISSMCRCVGISKDCYFRWIKEKPEFAAGVELAKSRGNKNIARLARKSLINKIVGYDYSETHEEGVKLSDGSIDVTSVKTFHKHVPPSDTAIIFALKNTDPQNFSDKVDVNHGGQEGNPVIHRIERVIVDANIIDI